MSWQAKAHRLIGEMAREAYRVAGNRPGRKHRPYSLPPVADALVMALGENDEEKAKALFVVLDCIPELGNGRVRPYL